jgi:3-deoxy-manno-octulosonate cytidylyltransferase (CMP-KDO synthetase)
MIIGVIPARYAATRLPGKPLVDLCGQSMIERVWRAASSCAELDHVLIATDDDRVAAEARRIGAEVVMTDPSLPSGTDRCYAAITSLSTAPEIVINIQGDEPLLQGAVLSDLVHALSVGTADVATPVSRIHEPHDLVDPNIVKVVATPSRRAIYFSRSPVPHVRSVDAARWLEHTTYWKHIGIYAYRTEALARHVALPTTELERLESLEQLRLLADGVHFECVPTDAPFISVDTPEDAERVRRFLAGG